MKRELSIQSNISDEMDDKLTALMTEYECITKITYYNGKAEIVFNESTSEAKKLKILKIISLL